MLDLPLCTLFLQGDVDIASCLNDSALMEPKLVIYEEEENVQQMFLCAENEVILEVPTCSSGLVDGLVHLMALYYVFDVQYPSFCKPTLYFMQDILMGRPDREKRPTRYATFIQNNSF